MFFTGVAGNQIQQNPDPQRVGAAAQLSHILVGAVAGRNLLIVPDVVARVLEGRVKAGIDPQGVAAEALHVGQLFGDAGKVAVVRMSVDELVARHRTAGDVQRSVVNVNTAAGRAVTAAAHNIAALYVQRSAVHGDYMLAAGVLEYTAP